MQLFNTTNKIIITCSNRLSVFLQQEMVELGFTPIRIFKTGVELKGTLTDCIKLNLNLRCASQILFSIYEFNAGNAQELYKAVLAFEWENIIASDGYFSITSNVNNDTINNSLFANVTVKDAIADRFRDKTGKRPNAGPELDKTVIHLYWQESAVEIFIDTSGETLSKHGYRKIPGKAPMLEALAAATLLATKWDRQSPFVNPMCGSSTLAIEAALLATNRRPGLYRTNYAFMHILEYKAEMYQQQRQRLDEIIVTVPELIIIATDISADAINISKINAGAAGVADIIEFAIGDFEATNIPEDKNGIIYGMQFSTKHLHLGFDITDKEILVNNKVKKVSDYSFIHLGQCIHADIIKEFLKEYI